MTTPPVTPQNTVKPVNPLSKTTFIAKQSMIVSIVAIVVAVIAIGFALLNYQSSTTHDQDIHTALQNSNKSQGVILSLNQSLQKQAAQLLQLKNRLKKFETAQDIPLQKTLAQVSYLVHLANLHLTVGHDVDTALSILNIAQAHLISANNPVLLPLQQALTADITALKKAPTINITGIYHQISQINQAIENLSPLPSNTSTTLSSAAANLNKNSTASMHWYDRLWHNLKNIKHLFIVDEVSNPTRPVTSPERIFYIKENIHIKLNIAQWALLHQNTTIYKNSLNTVKTWLLQYFSMRDATKPLVKQLDQLAKRDISVKLPLLLNTLKALSHIHLTSKPIVNSSTKPLPIKKAPVKAHKTKPNKSATLPHAKGVEV